MKAIITVLGNDTVGIIAGVCGILAENNVNVLDISQTILQDCFTMVMVVDIKKCSVDFAALSYKLKSWGEEKNLSVRIQREEIFEAMHRI